MHPFHDNKHSKFISILRKNKAIEPSVIIGVSVRVQMCSTQCIQYSEIMTISQAHYRVFIKQKTTFTVQGGGEK